MYSTSCANTHHDVTTFEVDRMIKNLLIEKISQDTIMDIIS